MTQLTEYQTTELIEAVREAGRIDVMPRFRNLDIGEISQKTGPADLVTIADQEAETRISAAAKAILPDALIVGEEAVEEDPSLLDALADADLAVIIDPVDGTANFASGLATFGVILAVVSEGETVFGLLYDPVLDDWIMATRGGGAWFCRPDGARQRLSGPTAKPQNLSYAYLSHALFPKAHQSAVTALMPDFQRASTLRCSCQEYRQFALGHVDLIVSGWAKPWDHAAGMLVAQECGGRVQSAGRDGYRPSGAVPPLVVSVAGADWVDDTDWVRLLNG